MELTVGLTVVVCFESVRNCKSKTCGSLCLEDGSSRT